MYQYQIHLQKIMLGRILPFLPMPSYIRKIVMSEGVWMVSGWCLDGVWGCLDGPTVILDAANRVLMPKQVKKSTISVTVLSYAIFFQWHQRGLFSPKIRTSQNANLARKECSNQKV